MKSALVNLHVFVLCAWIEAMKTSQNPDLARLWTEQRNPTSAQLDTLSALEIARVINSEDATVAVVLAAALPAIAQTIDAVAHAIGAGGRLIYVGAGTSGRIAALDASECPPTFNSDPKTVQFVIAGGTKALWSAVEGEEDSADLGRRDIRKMKPGKKDVVVGLAASGRTPYTVAALEFARSRGARTVAVTCNPGSPLERTAEIAIVAPVGPEVVTGSTRMKAGTAQKLVCNMITTGAMARLGYVYGNLMVNVHLKNKKLVERGISILMEGAGVAREQAVRALRAAKGSVPVALVILKTGINRKEAERRLKTTRGNVRRAMGRP
jgi:N-acetylmuramic acid 6-phosphate etherase